MTVPATTRKAGPFTGTGSQTVFPFSFKIFAVTDVKLVQADANGIETTLSSGYTVTMNSDQVATPGGSVTLSTALASGYKLSIIGNLPYDQTLAIPGGGNYNPVAHENALDRNVEQMQQISEVAGRQLVLPVTAAIANTTLPSPASNKLISWNASADGLQNIDPVSLATVVAFGTANADVFTGTGAQTAFTLSANPGAQANLDVSVGGVTQTPGLDYTWSGGTTVAFTAAPPNGARVLLRYFQGLPQGTTDSAASTYTPAGTGAVATTVQTKLRESVSVKDFGAKGDGVTDDTAAIQAAINSGAKCVTFPAGVYQTASQLTLVSGQTLQGQGAGVTTVIAKAATNFQYVAFNSGGSNIRVSGITFDANQANRSGVLTTTAIPMLLTGVADCHVVECVFQNAIGTAVVSGFGLAIGGTSTRCTVHNCRFLNNGTAGKPADGIFCSASDSLISNCIAYNCTDTGFVIESASYSGIVGCVSDGCSCGGAITNAINTDTYGNYINGLTVSNWNAAVTGGVQVGCPLSSSTGVLYDTLVNAVVMRANTGGGYGTGAAINVRSTGTPKPTRVTVSNCIIEGATAQGILFNTGVSCSALGNSVKQTGSAAIQFVGGTGHTAQGNVIDTTSFGVIGASASTVTAQGNICSNVSYGTYAFDTSVVNSYGNTVLTPSAAYHGKDAGATLNLIGQVSGAPIIGNASGAVPTGALNNKFLVYDKAGNPIGYVPTYAS